LNRDFHQASLKPTKQQTRNKSAAVAEVCLPEREEYNVSKTLIGPNACKEAGIESLGITGPTTIYKNLTFQQLFEHEVANNEGKVASCEYGDTFTVDTGRFTGRSPKDKWMVKNVGSESDRHLDWGDINQPTTPEVFKELYEKAVGLCIRLLLRSKSKESKKDSFRARNGLATAFCYQHVHSPK
jgi:Phosphoenolpyruvate carboxykinase